MVRLIRSAVDRGFTLFDALSTTQLAERGAGASAIEIEGDRYPPALEARTGR